MAQTNITNTNQTQTAGETASSPTGTSKPANPAAGMQAVAGGAFQQMPQVPQQQAHQMDALQQQVTAFSQQQQQNQGFVSASLYVGDLHPEVGESLLFDIFNAVGPISSIRVCRDAVTRRSLGYAYVNYHSQADAARALDTLNFSPIKGRTCRIMWSQRDPSMRRNQRGNLFVKNLDPSIETKDLYDTFANFGKILSCKVVTDRETGESRGHGYVHFDEENDANDAIEELNGAEIDGRAIVVERFVPKTDRPDNNEWTNVYIKNIPTHWDEEKLENVFKECGEIASVVIMKGDKGESKGFGFVDFKKHDSAASAVESFHGKEVLTKEGEESGYVLTNEVGESKPEEKETTKEENESKGEENKEESSEKKEEKSAEDEKKGKSLRLFVTRAQKKSERERELRSRFEQEKQERLNKFQGVNLYVKNLHEDVDEDMLRTEFAPFGTITSARIMRDQGDKARAKTGNDGKMVFPSKGFGFVCFSAPEEATKAVTEMNGKMILNKPIYVALAQRKDSRRAQLEAQHSQRAPGMNRGIPMQNPMFPGAPMFFPGAIPGPQGGGMRGAANFNFVSPMMPRGMVPQPRPGMGMTGFPRGAAGAGGFGGMQGYPQGMPTAGNPQAGQMGGVPQNNPNAMRRGGGMAGGPGGRQPRGPTGPNGQGAMSGPGQQGQQGQQQQQQQQPNVKYAPGARNQPGAVPYQQMAMQGGFQNQSRKPEAKPSGALNTAELANASEEQQKNLIGERMFPLIQAKQPDHAGKITGMLLEMDNPELLHLLESPEALDAKIKEALNVLEQHKA